MSFKTRSEMEVKPAEAGGAGVSKNELFSSEKSEGFCWVQRSIKVRAFSTGGRVVQIANHFDSPYGTAYGKYFFTS